MGFWSRLVGYMVPRSPAIAAPSALRERIGLLSGEISHLSPSEVARALGAESLINGSEFFATHQLRTPLRILSRHGEVHLDMHRPPPVIATEMWHGDWSPHLKTWRELGSVVDIPEFQSTFASEAGQVRSDEYLPFLIAVRSVVEADGLPIVRRERLHRELMNANWAAFVQKLGGPDAVLDRFFPPFVITIKGLPREAIDALQNKGLKTPNMILAVSDGDLLAIKGVGPAKLRVIRAACVAAQEPDEELCDLVLR